ncbi:MAG: zinc ABC transporter substrate-binding protein [Rhizobiales bacterium]|nr:zinc ABC transporter substrate-binding protein [Hyphomicrobiales bacterium]MBI3671856.1 zinc ABC transporter substrate-binding protein [Hyphomicrobiales bacterium]
MRRLALVLVALLLAGPAAAGPKVIASVLPVQSIVAAVMGATGTPELLFSGRLSEHVAGLSPRQIEALASADLVFMVSHSLEFRLGEVDGGEAVGGKRFVELANAPGLRLLPVRQGGTWEADSDAPRPAASSGSNLILRSDPHAWLDPENAKAMALAVAAELAKADPANAAAYSANAAAFAASLAATSRDIAAELAPVRHKPFIVFHDAYQYFEARFGLQAAGSISDISAVTPSARRLKEIRDRLAATGAACVFREPQFSDKYVRTVIEGSAAKSGVLDGLGADLAPGPGAYGELLRNLAMSLRACLEG